MPQMTMPLRPRDRKQIGNLQSGDAISFALHVTASDSWIDDVKKIRREDVALAVVAPTPAQSHATRLREGNALPSFGLTSAKGEQIDEQTYRERPLVLTFIFTRCPLPNFCPRMSENFLELQRTEIGAALLSITIDSAIRYSQVLQSDAEHLYADPTRWTFATGEPAQIDNLTSAFSVYRENEGGTITHGLATALVDSHGRIVRIWRGNSWKPQEVIDALAQLGN